MQKKESMNSKIRCKMIESGQEKQKKDRKKKQSLRDLQSSSSRTSARIVGVSEGGRNI